MKQRFLLLVLAVLMIVTFCACNGNGENPATSENPGSTANPSGSTSTVNGYGFQVTGTSGAVTLYADMDFSTVVSSLGDQANYFEAPSCAFNGLDKIYTYSNFEVHTYPDGEADRISMILILNDLVSTPEGISIGSTQAQMETAYGTGYAQSGSAYTYTKDNMKLTFLMTDGTITSIEYDSLTLTE